MVVLLPSESKVTDAIVTETFLSLTLFRGVVRGDLSLICQCLVLFLCRHSLIAVNTASARLFSRANVVQSSKVV